MDDKSKQDLEWVRLLENVARHSVGSAGARRILALEPETSLPSARQRMQLVAEALAATESDRPIPARATPDAEAALARLEKGADANGRELRDIADLLGQGRVLRTYAAAERAAHPLLAEALTSDAALDSLYELLDRALERDGSVSDDASPALGIARRRVGEVRAELARRLTELVHRYSEVLQDEYWTEREGRFVLPVRTDTHVKVQGVVLGSSASGATLFVEPHELTDLGNRLKVAEAEVEREQARVIAELGARVSTQVGAVSRALEASITAETLDALSRWALETRSVALLPEAKPEAFLLRMRHPLLLAQGVSVVPNDLEIRSGNALVLSGPNAGGKTVALKCLGLAAWMARAGIPLPLDPSSKIGWFDPVLTDIGDQQSLLSSLSTFSAHVQNLAAFIERAGEHTLVLLDEVAAGTDPEEGAALAVAVLEALVEKRAAIAVTTHYERLKELGSKAGPFVNASVGFDLDSMAPTFRVTLGVPGASSALAVAQRYGIGASIVARAQALLPERALEREELVRRLDTERERLEKARARAEADAEQARELREQAEIERAAARREEREKLGRERAELFAAVREARGKLRAARERLERAPREKTALKEIEKSIDDAAREIAIGSPLDTATRASPARAAGAPAERDLVIGARVLVPRLGLSAEVIEPPAKGQVRVAAGGLKLLVRIDEIRFEAPPKPKPKDKPAHRRQESARQLELADGYVPMRVESNTLDIRGQRVDEALEQVDVFIDRMLRSGERAAYVLHGHGTGALKLAVRAHLSAARYVTRAHPAEPDDGGDAFTQFWLDG